MNEGRLLHMTHDIPPITVIMPVYNRGNQLLRNSIESVLQQDFPDFEFLILDDGSTDDSLSIIQHYAAQDRRIRILQHPQNKGIPISTNRLLDNVQTEFVALLDSDDVCMPHRLSCQCAFLQRNPHIDIVGSYAHPDKQGAISDWEIKTVTAFFIPVLTNSTIMMRMKTINQHHLRYKSDFPFSQDFQFWCDCLPCVQFAVIPQFLLKSITHPNQATAQHVKTWQANHLIILQDVLQKHHIRVSNRTLMIRLGWFDSNTVRKNDIVDLVAHTRSVLAIRDFYGYSGVHMGAFFCFLPFAAPLLLFEDLLRLMIHIFPLTGKKSVNPSAWSTRRYIIFCTKIIIQAAERKISLLPIPGAKKIYFILRVLRVAFRALKPLPRTPHERRFSAAHENNCYHARL